MGPSVCGVSTTIGTYEDHDPFGNPNRNNLIIVLKEKNNTLILCQLICLTCRMIGYLTRHCCEQGTFWDPLTEQCQEGVFLL